MATSKQQYQRSRFLFKGSLSSTIAQCNYMVDINCLSWWERYKVRKIIRIAKSLLKGYTCQK